MLQCSWFVCHLAFGLLFLLVSSTKTRCINEIDGSYGVGSLEVLEFFYIIHRLNSFDYCATNVLA